MITHDLIQGSPEWLAYRAQHFNASDAPAMLGCSAYKSRSDLIAELATGLTAEVDAGTQRRFDDGHHYEALARPVAESIIGEDLYPVVGSEGKYSASFDGLTLDESTGFEHKTLNDELRAVFADIESINPDYRDTSASALLPKMYRVQMEQQCMVSGAIRILFMASKWNGEELAEESHCWYLPDAALRAEIVSGWALLEAEVAAYVPAQVVEKLVANSFETLPAIAVQIKGEVVASNIPAFKERLSAYIASINTNLTTDQHFADADAAVKNCAATEKRIAATKEQVLGQVASIDEVIRALDDADAQLSKIRIHLEKEIKAKKDLLKAGILTKAQQALKDHVTLLEKEIAPITLTYQARDFAGVMKGLRTLSTLQNAADTELAAGKITVNALASSIRARQAWFKVEAASYESLFPDLQQIIQKADDDFKLVVASRITKQKTDDEAKLEIERKRIQAEEQAKAVAALAPAVESFAESLPEIASAVPVTAEVLIDLAEPGTDVTMAATVIDSIINFGDEGKPPTLKLGEISLRLGFTVTADFMLSLGFAPAATEKNSKLFHESDFTSICSALVRHITAVQAKKFTVTL